MTVRDLNGAVFGRLRVLARAGSTADHRAVWVCLCECGGVAVVPGKPLTSGNTKTCGCGKVDAMRRAQTLRTYPSVDPSVRRARCTWNDMRHRCSNSANKAYGNYGGRGITVCPAWARFSQFLADMGPPADGMTLDRIDNDKGYSPENCRWATVAQQARNKRSNVYVTFKGERLTVQDWAKRLGTGHGNLRRRIALWGIELALTTPVSRKNHRVARPQPHTAP